MKHRKLKLGAVCLAILLGLCTPLSVAAAGTTGQTTVTVGFVPGVLQIDSVPASLPFGNTNAVPPLPASLPLTEGRTVSVSDATSATAGWNLTAALNPFTSNGETTLQGASVVVVGATPTGSTGGGLGPAESPARIEIVSAATPEAELVMSAAAGAGYGTWTETWTTANTSLDIPDNGTFIPQGTHTAQMDWVLAVGPNPETPTP